MSTFVIPLQQGRQSVQVTFGGSDYVLVFEYWDTDQGGWTIDIEDTLGNPLVQGLPLVTGADLLAQYEYLGLGGQLVVLTNGDDPDAVPTYANLGTDCNLYWIPN